jgi:hypothetical protein
MLQAMLQGGFMESKDGEIQFPEIKSAVLEKVIQYMYYKVRYGRGNQSPPDFQIEPEVYTSAQTNYHYTFLLSLYFIIIVNIA